MTWRRRLPSADDPRRRHEESHFTENHDGSGLRLVSIGDAFGDAGFYRIQRTGASLRVWRIASLHEEFQLFVDADGETRCEHEVRFLGMRVLTLHYRVSPVAS